MSYDEIKKIKFGSAEDEKSEAYDVFALRVKCGKPATIVLSKVQELLICAINGYKEDFDSLDKWANFLPEWFVNQCDLDEDSTVESETKWALNSWLYWLDPDERQWWWWNSKIISDEEFELSIEVADYPFMWGALKWMLLSSGASHIELLT